MEAARKTEYRPGAGEMRSEAMKRLGEVYRESEITSIFNSNVLEGGLVYIHRLRTVYYRMHLEEESIKEFEKQLKL